MTKTTIRFVLMLIAALLFGDRAMALTCNFTVNNVNFGSVNLLGGASYDSTATLTATCQNVLNLSLSIRICPNIGAGSGGLNGTTRLMKDASNHPLEYQLYRNSGRTLVWGSSDVPTLGTPPPLDMLLLPLTNNSASLTIYGRILPNQQSALGGPYQSSFAGAEAKFTYTTYTVFAPACSTVADNPTQVSFSALANVDRTCNVTAQDINFGIHGLLNAQLDAGGGLLVTCTSGLPYTVSLNGGISGAAPTQRKMVKGSESILYGLYKNVARTQPFGNGAGETVSGTGDGTAQPFPIYGRVGVQPTPTPGVYKDTVIVTVTY